MSRLANMIAHMRRFIELQSLLLATFRQTFPGVSDWDYLLDAPKTGELQVNGDTWVFRKHGRGIRFENQDVIVVDAHQHISVECGIDAWRILVYIESFGGSLSESLGERALQEVFDELLDQGTLSMINAKGIYRLSEPVKHEAVDGSS